MWVATMRGIIVSVAALVASSTVLGDKKPLPMHRSLKEIPDPHHRMLVRRLADSVKEEFHAFHAKGLASTERATFESAALAQRLHWRVGGHVDLDDESRALTASAVEIGKKEYVEEIIAGLSYERLLRGSGRGLASTGSKVFWTIIFVLAIGIIVAFSLINILTNGGQMEPVDWISLDNDYMRARPATSFDGIEPCNELPMRKSLYSDGSTPKYAYLPITGGVFDYLVGQILAALNQNARFLQDVADDPIVMNGFDTAISGWTGRFVRTEALPNNSTCFAEGQPCFFNAECCLDPNDDNVVFCNGTDRSEATVDEQKGTCVWQDKEKTDFILEPFCLAFGVAKNGLPDAFGWAPLLSWPPVNADPYVAWFLPWCYFGFVGNCKFCELTEGVEGKIITIGGYPFQTTLQFSGFAFTWSDEGALELNAGDMITVWDGFINRDLVVPGVRFWVAFTINLIPGETYLLRKSFCESGFGFFSKAGVLNTFGRYFLQIRFELFVAVNEYEVYQYPNGTVDESLVNAEGKNFAGQNVGDPEELADETSAPSPPPSARRLDFLDDIANGSGRRVLDADDADAWRILSETQTEACVVAAITRMEISIPVIGGITFGNAVAGWCFLPPEDTGVQCTPNGLFINLQTRIQLVGGLAGVLGAFIDSKLTDPPGTVSDPSRGGITIGVYFDQSKVFQAAVLRLEPPTWSFFGIQLNTVGALPSIHLQWIKGAEVERRRLSILRTRTAEGNWIPNCQQIGETCNEGFWVPFYKDEKEYNELKGGNHKYEICEDLLLNVNQDADKLLYYNRMMTAEPVPVANDPDDAYRISPRYEQWMTPPSYDFSSDPDNNIWIVYFGFRNVGNALLRLSELSISAVLSNPVGRTDNNADALVVFIRLFCRVEVLSFAGIELAFTARNYEDAESTNPKAWLFLGQFGVVALGVRSEIVLSKVTDFDNRRFRHLRESDPESYHRALSEDSLEKNWNADLSVYCESKVCDAVAAFVEGAGEVFAAAGEAISDFFREDIVNIGNDIANLAKGWAEDFVKLVDGFKRAAEAIFEEDGLLDLMLPQERRKALENGARADLSANITDFADIGRALEAGLTLVGLAILEGISDLLTLFGDIYEFFADISKLVVPWDEIRTMPDYYSNLNACEPGCSATRTSKPNDLNELKRNCWCKDQFNCPVKLPQTRRCSNEWQCNPFPACWPRKECGDWALVPIKTKDKNDNDVFPRFDGQKYDKACREERCIDLAEMEKKQGQMQTKGDIITSNWNERWKGLFILRPGPSIIRRRLNGDPVVKIGDATSSGSVSSETMRQSFEFKTDLTDFTKLSPNELDPSMTSETDSIMFDPSVYDRGQNGTDGISSDADPKDFANLFNKRTSCQVLGDIDPCDETFIAANGNIDPPRLKKTDKRSKIQLNCTEYPSIASAWEAKLSGSDQSFVRRNRSRRLQGLQCSKKPRETNLDRAVLEILRNQIEAGDVGIEITPGVVNNDNGADAFAEFRRLGLVDECFDCLDPNNIVARRHLRKLDVSDFEIDVFLECAAPGCTSYDWDISVTATDITGTSNSVLFTVSVPYGTPWLGGQTPSSVQTRCHDDEILESDLVDDSIMRQVYGEHAFRPSLLLTNCPNPNLYLDRKEDVTLNSDFNRCERDYEVVQRTWDLESKDTTCSFTPQVAFFRQNITRGGLLVNGEPAIPEFGGLVNMTYYLPNIRNATIETSVSDYFANFPMGMPQLECGSCSIEYNHSFPFGCDEVGENVVIIEVINGIGNSYSNTAIATVIDNVPPNMVTRNHTVVLNKFGWLNESDVVTVLDVDAGTWDNCEIASRSVAPTPIYQCADEGPQYTTLTAVDVNGNTNSQTTLVTVHDAARLGIGDDLYLDLQEVKKKTDKYEAEKMKDDFGFDGCEEIAVYVRPDGETNFIPLSYGWNETEKWKIPYKLSPDKPEVVTFFDTLCQGLPPLSSKSSKGGLGLFCRGEVKAEVLCKEAKGRGKGGSRRRSVRKLPAKKNKKIRKNRKKLGLGLGSTDSAKKFDNIFEQSLNVAVTADHNSKDDKYEYFQTCYRAKVFTAL